MEQPEQKEIILEPYLSTINGILDKMTFILFDNSKPYSFDYAFKNRFDTLIGEIKLALEEKENAIISPSITNRLPIFLPLETSRIAFFAYQSKSVRAIDIDELETILTRQAEKRSRANEFPHSDIRKLVSADLATFNDYHTKHLFDTYRRDITTPAVQFNAYDKEDTLLIEKSFVRGGLVFDMDPKEFSQKVTITYPRHRKRRSDQKSDYLPLKLIKIRGFNPPKAAHPS
jgi:hypothetical protein